MRHTSHAYIYTRITLACHSIAHNPHAHCRVYENAHTYVCARELLFMPKIFAYSLILIILIVIKIFRLIL